MQKAVIQLCLFTVLLFFCSTWGYWMWLHKEDPLIDTLVQTGPEREALPSVYLAELLQLSIDHPIRASRFDVRGAQERLKQCALFKEVQVSLYRNRVAVDYTLRRPIAYLQDKTPLAIDEEGYLFVYQPYRPQQRLPFITLGEAHIGERVSGPLWELVQELRYKMAQLPLQHSMYLQAIDVSRLQAPYLGRQEIVLVLESVYMPKQKHYLRLSSKNYSKELENYASLQPSLFQSDIPETVIDLRLTRFAYIQEKR